MLLRPLPPEGAPGGGRWRNKSTWLGLQSCDAAEAGALRPMPRATRIEVQDGRTRMGGVGKCDQARKQQWRVTAERVDEP